MITKSTLSLGILLSLLSTFPAAHAEADFDLPSSAESTYEILSPSEADFWNSILPRLDADSATLPPEFEDTLLRRYGPQLTDFHPATIDARFAQLARNSRARMRTPRGACYQRSRYIHSRFSKMSERTGYLHIQCPGNHGRLQVRDRSTGRTFVYSNFHWANLVEIESGDRRGLAVVDVQFQDSPVTLSRYLGQLSVRQRLRPAGTKAVRGLSTCYWKLQVPGGSLLHKYSWR